MEMEDDTLVVSFTADRVGELTWPILPTQPALRGYILPIGEGVYAPCDDPLWRAELVKREALTTTDGLYLPLWGLDFGHHTLTYLLTNPFNNELAFQQKSAMLSAHLTHQFTKNAKVKTYGVRIILGSGSPVEPARQYRRWLIKTGKFVSLKEKIRQTPEALKLLGAAHVYLWGDGIIPQMVTTLQKSGLDRLWLGSPGWKELQGSPQTIPSAKAAGFLIGPYDDYNCVHAPDAKPDETWETAQFDQKLYETGAVVRWDGKKRTGFQGKGYLLSPLAAQPYVKQRVSQLMQEFKANSWFIDSDAFGEVSEDYSLVHPASQEDDCRARLGRMAWIRDTYRLVIGSEGGTAFAASTIHFAHGMMTPVLGWGDPDLATNPASRYFLGSYFPPRAPSKFFKQVPLKPSYYHCYMDPRFRLPLYQTAFHDSVVTTHHWTSPTLKFEDQVVERSLLELLYSIPPLYHLNQEEFARRKVWIKAQYAFFSPLHRITGLLPLTDFSWLTADHRVQRTVFGDRVECIANFQVKPYLDKGILIPAQSILARNRETGVSTVFTPKSS